MITFENKSEMCGFGSKLH